MVSLILVLCLHGSCVERPITPVEPLNGLAACMVAGPQAGAEWIAMHPMQAAEGWTFAKWRCQWGKPAEKAA